MHVDSEAAKAQKAMEAQIIATEKDVLRELEEAAAKEEGRDDGEKVEDSSALRNQFNFSDRTYQTVIQARRDAEIMTEPPTSIEFSAVASQWEIWDWYTKDLSEKDRKIEKDKNRNKKKLDVGSTRKVFQNDKVKKKDPMYTYAMQASLRLVERVVNQNAFDDILMDFKFWEDDSDKIKPDTGSLLPVRIQGASMDTTYFAH
jgi:hypothetical protein